MDYLKQWFLDPTLDKLLVAVVGILLIFALAGVVRRSLSRSVAESQTRYRIRKLVTFLAYTLVILFLGIVFKDRLGGLTVALGVAGAGVAFALQEVIASVAGWVAVSFGGFYASGDRIQLGGIKGDVIDVGILRTTLMECGEWVRSDQYTGRIVRVANSFVFKEPVFNYSADFPFLWDEISVPIKHGTDHQLVKEILTRVVNEVVGNYVAHAKDSWTGIAAKYMVEAAMVDPQITLIFNDNWIEFSVRYVVDYKARRSTKDRLFTRILDELGQTEGRVAIASTTLQLVDPMPVDVRVMARRDEAKPVL